MNANAKKWVEALRSGDYSQTTGQLHVTVDSEDRYCCLGVACKLAVEGGVMVSTDQHTQDGVITHTYDQNASLLPTSVIKWLGLKECDGTYLKDDGDFSSTLAEDNDEHDFTFEQIADVIERQPEGLFADEKEETA
jgi:hypothetical protein